MAGAVAGLAGFAIPLLFGAAFSASTPVCSCSCAVWPSATRAPSQGGPQRARATRTPEHRTPVACVVNIVSTVVLVVPLGALGAAIATTIGNVVSGGLNLLFLRAVSGIPCATSSASDGVILETS